jgi:hypothetical protein
VWQTDAGVVVPAPASPTKGVCQTTTTNKLQIYIIENTGVLTMADIVAATGAVKILSVTVVQQAGTGIILGDLQSSHIYTGMAFTWSTNDLGADTLSTSAISFDAVGGNQIITATYII